MYIVSGWSPVATPTVASFLSGTVAGAGAARRLVAAALRTDTCTYLNHAYKREQATHAPLLNIGWLAGWLGVFNI